MKPRPRLFTADPEILGGNGPAATVIDFPSAEVTPAAPAAESATEAPAATEPSLLEKVTASIQSKGKLLADCNAATARADKAEAELQGLRLQLSTLNSQLATLCAERSGIEAALIAAIAEKQEVDTAAASQIAALGFEPAALPAASAAPEETRATLAAQIEKETDPKKLWALTEKYEALAH